MALSSAGTLLLCALTAATIDGSALQDCNCLILSSTLALISGGSDWLKPVPASSTAERAAVLKRFDEACIWYLLAKANRCGTRKGMWGRFRAVSYTHLRA